VLCRFYYLDDRITQVRTFVESRLDFFPCSLYLAMDFARQVFQREEELAKAPDTEKTTSNIPALAKDADIKEAIKLMKLEFEDIIELTQELSTRVEGIVSAVRAGKPMPLSPKFLSREDFIKKLENRVQELYHASALKIYGVGVIELSLNNLSPCVQRRIDGNTTVVTRDNYRFSALGEKRCLLLNAVALEGFNFQTQAQLRETAGIRTFSKKKKMPPFAQKEFFSLLDRNGSAGLMVYNYDVKSVTLREKQEGEEKTPV